MFKKILPLLFLPSILFSQEWAKSLSDKKNPTFFEIQNAFYGYYKTHTDSSEDGDYAKFKRWEWYWENRVDKNGNFPDPMITWNEFYKYKQQKESEKNSNILMTGNWRPRGPATIPSNSSYPTTPPGMGRLNCIAFHPTNQNIFWVGSPSGGLWKTTNGGASWIPLTDNLPDIGISDIAIDYTNPNIIYIATGDGDHPPYYADCCIAATNSIGIMKSTDGGITWNLTGLNWGAYQQNVIRKLIIHPTNPNILIAATSNGVWKTSNGGITWSNTFSNKYFTDIVFKPDNPNRVYAAEYNPSGNAGIYISMDCANTFPLVNYVAANAMRIKLGVTQLNSQYVDALVASTLNDGWLKGMYSSSDSAMNFSFVYGTFSDNNLLADTCSGNWCSQCSQGWYDLVYMIDPININTSWGGGINIWKSLNAGSTWNINTTSKGDCATQPVHSDHHFLTYNPLNNYIYDCNDGGLFRTTNGGLSWLNLSGGLQISQIYRLGQNASDTSDIICGLQDNGTYELFQGVWYQDVGGDGAESIIDPSNGNIEYAGYHSGVLIKTINGFASTPTNISPSSNGAWVTPFVMHPTVPSALLAGYKDVWATNNGGSSWFQISSNLSSIPLKSLAIAPSNANYIYTASDNQAYMTTNGGTTWNNITTGLPLSFCNASYIAIKQTDPNTAWITLSGYWNAAKVYKTTNGGASWTNVSGSLPNIPVNCIVYENGSNDGVYIGTDVGVYYRDNSMSDWIQFSTGLPNVIVNELEINYTSQKIRAATFGRGLWEGNLFGAFVSVGNEEKKYLLKIFPNPSSGQFHLTCDSEIGIRKIEITNSIGEVVKEISVTNNNQELDVSDLKNGIYFLRFDSKITIKPEKIIKQ